MVTAGLFIEGSPYKYLMRLFNYRYRAIGFGMSFGLARLHSELQASLVPFGPVKSGVSTNWRNQF
jgi:hypothetical protein